MKQPRKTLSSGLLLLGAFILWTATVCLADVQAIGPEGSSVGLATMNRFVHDLTGVHMTLYTLTDWLGLIPIGFMLGFAILGLVQWVKRKHIGSVDRSLLILGVFYLSVMAAYLFFEQVVINRRPVLIDGFLEASYPSSTTMLALCVMPTALWQFNNRIQNRMFRRWIAGLIMIFTIFMVVGRLLSGVHWFSDIVGGILLSAGLTKLYRFACCKPGKEERR